MTKQEILESLNNEQQEVAKHSEGPCFVIAGPGSGKTTTVVARTQYMILNGIDPSNIVLFTFTNKAANEIKERVLKRIGEAGKAITVGTYHSVCHRLLRKYAKAIGYTNNFSILSPEDCEKIIKKIAKNHDVVPELLQGAISGYKNTATTPQNAIINAQNDTQKAFAKMYQMYQDELFRQMAMDFDDLLLNTIRLLENNSDIRRTINNQWQYITGDEFHDSSRTDLRLMQLLAGKSQNICMILDDNQSIYGFRGADIEAVVASKDIFIGTQIFNLSKNYRSSQTIVDASKSLIAKNSIGFEKKIEAARDYKGSPVIMTKCKNALDEAAKIINYVKMVNTKYKVPYNEIAILYRMSYLSRTLEQAFMTARIPYKIIGGLPFFNRLEVQDILSFMKLTVNEYDVSAFKRTIQIPRRGIGDKTIDKIDEFARNYPGGPIPIRQAIREIELTGKQGKSLKEYNDLLELFDTKKVELSPDEFIKFILTKLKYTDHLQDTQKEDIQPRIENLLELINVAKEYDEVEELLIQASLFSKEEESDDNPKVQLMTMHSSKGLEFKAVMTIGMNEGISPHHKSLTDSKQLEEERRLAYVAITRAKDYLFMTYPQQIMSQGRMTYAKPSRFLNEIDSKYVYKN
jgi:DNA helicase-2/ATP-dependent DNA helicase PcrA